MKTPTLGQPASERESLPDPLHHHVHKEHLMKNLTLATTILGACLLFSGLAMADDSAAGTGSNMPGMDIQHMKNMAMPAASTQASKGKAGASKANASQDKKCLDQHQGLMDKPATKNTVKCDYAHQYKMRAPTKPQDTAKTAP